MKFSEVVGQTVAWLQREGRVSYRALKREFAVDDDFLEDLKEELIAVKELAVDKDGKMLVWVGEPEEQKPRSEEHEKLQAQSGERSIAEEDTGWAQEAKATLRSPLSAPPPMSHTPRADGERRQLTVMFIDLVGSTTLSQQLDPEDYHARVVAYQTACQQVIARYEGHIAQFLGDGVLVYFGYPVAHEDDAARAVRSGMEIVTAVRQLAFTSPLQVRIGIHTGPVVVGEIGAGAHTERLALGETPNLAARIQGHADPDTVVLSATTRRLVAGLFECEELEPQPLKGISLPASLYRVAKESEAQSRFEVAVQAGLTPLVGRAHEVGLLQERWEQARQGAGQVILLSGEPGIGKSRLVQEFKTAVTQAGATRIEFRCSPYHRNSAFYPIIDHLQRLLQFQREDTPQAKLAKLQQTLRAYRFPQADTLLLFAALLLLPQPEGFPSLTLSPEQQKQKTQQALVAWLMEETEKAAVYCAWEDLHWADPSTLEFLTLFLAQVPTARLLALLTFRPEFSPPWGPRSHISQLTLSRLGRNHVETMVGKVSGGKALPPEVLRQIVAKTDGVPLFVEELTKMVLESGLLREESGRYVGANSDAPIPPLAIPSTLQDSLMARLDRLATTREIAQLGAILGREFSYELIHAVSPVEEEALQQGLQQLVDTELIYQRGLPPQATYLFKHALIQDTAYQSLLKSKRQQYHHQIARVFEARFPDPTETQPELVAHHYTEAGLGAQAIPYWQRAGERAVQRSANAEAISHLTKGLELLTALPDTPERSRQELSLRTVLGPALIATKGNAAPEVEQTYARAVELCRQTGDPSQLFPVLFGLRSVYLVRGEVQTAHELGEQLLSLAETAQDSGFLLEARIALGNTAFIRGEFALARSQFEHALELYDLQQHRSHAFMYGLDPGVFSLGRIAWTLWGLGYPDQALQRGRDMLALAQEISHSFSSAIAGLHAAGVYLYRGEFLAAQQQAEATIAFCTEHKFVNFLGQMIGFQGWVLLEQGLHQEGIAKIRQGLAACQATGAVLFRPFFLAPMIDSYLKAAQTAEGDTVLAEAFAIVAKTGERYNEAELYRLKGELTLQKGRVASPMPSAPDPQPLTPDPRGEAEAYFLKAIEIAQSQQAKSWELRATMSLARLRQQQGKKTEAHQLLSEVYNWFTEGFDTKDLQEAKALLEELT
jgi:class 3 adenylate cyclase/predicted ATPase